MAAILERVGRSAESSQSHSGLLAPFRAGSGGGMPCDLSYSPGELGRETDVVGGFECLEAIFLILRQGKLPDERLE